MRSNQRLGLLLAVVLVFLPNCGKSSGGVLPPPPPSALSYATVTAVYTVGMAIATNSPTSAGGAVTSYGVNPPLPSGLSLSTTTGIISGTPAAMAAATIYTVTATNAGGNTATTLSITVNAALSYIPSTAVYTINVLITPLSPAVAGAPATGYSVSPPLPAGLNLDMTTGIISGTPTVLANTANYEITATVTGGSATASWTPGNQLLVTASPAWSTMAMRTKDSTLRPTTTTKRPPKIVASFTPIDTFASRIDGFARIFTVVLRSNCRRWDQCTSLRCSWSSVSSSRACSSQRARCADSHFLMKM